MIESKNEYMASEQADASMRRQMREIRKTIHDVTGMPASADLHVGVLWLVEEWKSARAELAARAHSCHGSKAHPSAADNEPATLIRAEDPFAARLRDMPPGSRIILERDAYDE